MAKKPLSYWLLKTEPEEWSWQDQTSQEGGVGKWDGVKNALAQKNMKSMQIGDLCFFYHSGRKAREIVGIVSVHEEWKPEEADDSGKIGFVMVKACTPMPKPVTLDEIKQEDGKGILDFVLLRQQRLSVVPVSANNWRKICEMGDVDAEKLSGPPEQLQGSKEACIAKASSEDHSEVFPEKEIKATSTPRRSTRPQKEKKGKDGDAELNNEVPVQKSRKGRTQKEKENPDAPGHSLNPTNKKSRRR